MRDTTNHGGVGESEKGCIGIRDEVHNGGELDREKGVSLYKDKLPS